MDDEPNLRHTLGYALRQEGYMVLEAEDGERALALLRTGHPDVAILDLMLPGIDGLEVCRRIRRESDVPVLMLTARDSEIDRIVGLEVGADDYLGKPFSTRELIARLRALLRRTRRGVAAAGHVVLRSAGVEVDTGRRRVSYGGREVQLTAKEFDLLAFLMSRPGVALTREQVLVAVWGHAYAGDARTVDTHVKTLRAALDDSAGRRIIETVRGIGYRFAERS